MGWLSILARDPKAFESTVAPHREGWIALHAHDLPGAWAGFDGDPNGRLRAGWELWQLFDDAAALDHAVWIRLADTWKTGPDNPIPALAAWSSACNADMADANRRWDAAPGRWAAALRSAIDGQAVDLPHLGERLSLHARAADGSEVDALRGALATSWTETDDAGARRRWEDPCGLRRLADGWSILAFGGNPDGAIAGIPDALAGALFAPWLDASDLRAARTQVTDSRIATSALPSVDRLGLAREDPSASDATHAREGQRALRASLDSFVDAASREPGGDLVEELALVQRQRQRWLVDRARTLLRAGRSNQAIALLEPAVDVTRRGVGPTNGPSLFVLLAEARLRTGRDREALDALQPALEAVPALHGTREMLADLVTLRGMGRLGDSKEE